MKYKMVVNPDALDDYLKKIHAIFPPDDLAGKNMDYDCIVNYYRKSSAGYKFFHSKKGVLHLALNYDGTFKKEGYYTHLREIAGQMKASGVRSVLELGCGKGCNSVFLAQQFPGVRFYGIDISDVNLNIARQKSRRLVNASFSYGDYHDLSFDACSFDMVFAIESLCYANNVNNLLAEVFRVLKNGGHVILYDGFRESAFEPLPVNLKQAAILTEKSMAVNNFKQIDSWLQCARESGFTTDAVLNLSQAVLPNMCRHQYLARGYFKYPVLSKFLLQILPLEMLLNAVAGLLMPFTVSNHAHGYYCIKLAKTRLKRGIPT